MNRTSLVRAVAIVAIALLGTPLHADEAVLQDGSRIIGTVTVLSAVLRNGASCVFVGSNRAAQEVLQ